MDTEELIEKNKSLKNLSTFRIGGNAEFFVLIKNELELKAVIEWAQKKAIKICFLGGGSNLLISDAGVSGLVVKIDSGEARLMGERIEVGAGKTLAETNHLAVSNNLSGLEWSVGIPSATIGGAIFGNAGAFSASISDVIETIEVFDVDKLKFYTFSLKDCEFSYRTSIFKKNQNWLIWKATLKLRRSNRRQIDELVEQSILHRTSSYPKLHNAGSIFKNISEEELRNASPVLPKMLEERGVSKFSSVGAGLIIDMAGLKGKKVGGAKVSLEHANFIVNAGHASSEDVFELIKKVKKDIKQKFNLELKEEIIYLGF